MDGLLRNHHDYEMLRDAYRNDDRLRAMQVGNLTSRLFEDLSRLELAEALLDTSIELAGQIAAIEFERSVKALADAGPDEPLPRVVDRLCRDRHLDHEAAERWRRAVGTRNRAIHGGAPQERDVRDLVQAMKEVSDAKISS